VAVDDIPPPSSPTKDPLLITLPTLYAMKAALYLALRETQMSQSDLAAKLGEDKKEIRRLLDPADAG
jgi:ribosome-binding protein aMBF1 (putative translation factor)